MWIAGLVIVGAVTAYAVGYFRERKVPQPPVRDPELPTNVKGSLRMLYEAYGEEVRIKYARNHSRRKAEKIAREFMLASAHFVVFALVTYACTTVEALAEGEILAYATLALTFLTMSLKAGQLTAAKETVETKESLLLHATEWVNSNRSNVFEHCPEEMWIPAIHARDEKSFHLY